MKNASILLIATLGLTSCTQPAQQSQTPAVQAQSHFEQLANLPFAENRPTANTAQTLQDELLFQRATQTYLWALPLVNTLGMKVGSEKQFGAGYNVLPIWKKRLDAKTLVTTPNSDVIYAMRDKPAQNPDGSTDIYLGQKAPAGKESNWMATPAGKGYFVVFRLYGPTEAAINKTWVPGDLEKLK